VQRLLLALILALCLHGLLLTYSLPGITTLSPRIMGKETIRINLTSVVSSETVKDVFEDTQNKKQEKDSRKPEESSPPKPLKIVAEMAPEQELEEDSPVALKAQAVKKIQRKSLNSKTTAAPSPQKPNKKLIQSTAPVSVKASPLYAKNPKPDYPALARRRGWDGTVILSVFISEKGAADRVRIHTSSGHSLLDKSALKTVASWKFLPGMESGHPVAMKVLIPVHFKLR
jgi:periplasmic protein TonB